MEESPNLVEDLCSIGTWIVNLAPSRSNNVTLVALQNIEVEERAYKETHWYLIAGNISQSDEVTHIRAQENVHC